MLMLLAGLILFLGVHSVRIFADDWRSRQIERFGEMPWKGIYSVISILGFVLIVWGYGVTRAESIALWAPPIWTRHLVSLLTLPAFVLIAAAYVPGTRIKAAVGHPMVLGVKLWALAHLAANGRLGGPASVRRVSRLGRARLLRCKAARPCRRSQLPGSPGLPSRRGRRGVRFGRLGSIRVSPARLADRRAPLRVSEVPQRTAGAFL